MKLNYNIIVIITLMLTLSGCSDFFDEDIRYTKAELVLDSGIRSRGIIDDIYTDYQFRYTNDFGVEYLTDNGVKSNAETGYANNNWSPTYNPYEYVWQQSYNNIRQVYQYIELVHNTGIDYFPSEENADTNETIVNRFYGEAYFLKAFAEWELLKIFGGPSADDQMLGFPIINEIFENNEDYALVERNTYQECVDQIMKDLDTAVKYLPLHYRLTGTATGDTDVETGRASGLAAYALKAKVALFAASPAFNPTNDITKWELAATLAEDLIVQNGGLKSLTSFNFSNVNNPDHLWRLRNGANSNAIENLAYPPSLYGDGQVNPSQNLVDAFSDSNGYPIAATESSYDENNPYTSRDSRFYKFIFYNGDNCYTDESCATFQPLEIYTGGADNFGGFLQNRGTRTGYYLKKFSSDLDFDPSSIDATTTLPKPYVQLGLTDLYLGYAEALNELSNNPSVLVAGYSFTAKEVLAKIRQRAGLINDPYLDVVSTDDVSFKTLLKNERRIELCFTGERFHDLRRWKEIDNIENVRGVKITKNEDATFSYDNIIVEERSYDKNKNYYLPLPYAELLLNSNLAQNKGW